jgi:hypothetical protein
MVGKLFAQLTVLIVVAVFFGLLLKHFNIALFVGIPLGIILQFGLYYGYITALSSMLN